MRMAGMRMAGVIQTLPRGAKSGCVGAALQRRCSPSVRGAFFRSRPPDLPAETVADGPKLHSSKYRDRNAIPASPGRLPPMRLGGKDARPIQQLHHFVVPHLGEMAIELADGQEVGRGMQTNRLVRLPPQPLERM